MSVYKLSTPSDGRNLYKKSPIICAIQLTNMKL